MMKRLAMFFMTGVLTTSMAWSVLAGEVTSERSADNVNVSKILWQFAGDLSPQQGMEINKGTAGLLHGVSHGYIVVAGGANFPGLGPARGGSKKTYPDIYVLKQQDGQLVEVNHEVLDHEVGYGASITTDKGIYYIGGSPSEGQGNKILLVRADSLGKVKTDVVGELPFTFSDGFAVLRGDILYVGAGKQDGKGTNKVYSLNLKTKDFKELPPVPNEASRTQCVAQLLDNKIYVFSGGSNIAYTDGYSYDITGNKWEQVADVQIDNEKISLLGADSVKLSNSSMLVIGGFNKAVYDDAVEKLGSLTGEELQNFRTNYFCADPAELKWNRKILVYNAKKNVWTAIGEVPFDAPCGEALILSQGKIYSINGEIKPGTRTKHMYCGILR